MLKTFLNARKQLQLDAAGYKFTGTAESFIKGRKGGRGEEVVGLLENERCRRKFVEGSRGTLPPKNLFKSRGSEMVFLTFSVV